MVRPLSTLLRAAAAPLTAAALPLLLVGCPPRAADEEPAPAVGATEAATAAATTAYEDVDPPKQPVPLAQQEGYAPPAELPAVSQETGWYDSQEALVQGVVQTATKGDADALRVFRVDQAEHQHLLWPHFDSSDPYLNIPHDFAYTNLGGGSKQGQRSLAKLLSGGTWTVVEIRFDKPDDVYPTFVLHQGTEVILAGEDGKRIETDLLGSVVEYGGRYKLLSYREP